MLAILYEIIDPLFTICGCCCKKLMYEQIKSIQCTINIDRFSKRNLVKVYINLLRGYENG